MVSSDIDVQIYQLAEIRSASGVPSEVGASNEALVEFLLSLYRKCNSFNYIRGIFLLENKNPPLILSYLQP